jgi:DNA-directed RNA polymerase subunit omega
VKAAAPLDPQAQGLQSLGFNVRKNQYTLTGDEIPMIEELKEEQIVNKVGGRFKLSTLIQKRLVALNAGSRPLVDMQTDNKLEIVVREIMEDKIYLDADAKIRIAGEVDEGTGGPPELDLSDL